MDIIVLPNQPIVVVADIHGDFDSFYRGIEANEYSDCIIIVAGDCGIGFHKKAYYETLFNSLNKKFVEKNISCYFLRGNHDDPYYFNNDIFSYSNVKTIKDYTVLSTNGKNILCVGGAISVDRIYRIDKYWRDCQIYAETMNVSLAEAKTKFVPLYWSDEPPYFDNDKIIEITNNDIKIDYVITHTSPSFCYKSDKDGVSYWLNKDNDLENVLNNERKVMDDIYQSLIENNHPLKKWIYGHFHGHNVEVINDIEFTALTNCDFKFDAKELNLYD